VIHIFNLRLLIGYSHLQLPQHAAIAMVSFILFIFKCMLHTGGVCHTHTDEYEYMIRTYMVYEYMIRTYMV